MDCDKKGLFTNHADTVEPVCFRRVSSFNASLASSCLNVELAFGTTPNRYKLYYPECRYYRDHLDIGFLYIRDEVITIMGCVTTGDSGNETVAATNPRQVS